MAGHRAAWEQEEMEASAGTPLARSGTVLVALLLSDEDRLLSAHNEARKEKEQKTHHKCLTEAIG